MPKTILRKTMLLEGLDEAGFAEAMQYILVRRFSRDDVILNQGSLPTAVYVILKGQVKISRHTENGIEAISQLLGPGQTLLESVALQPHPSPVTVQALGAVELAALPVSLVQRFLASQPTFAQAYVQLLCQRTEELTQLVEHIAAHPAEDRVASFLLATMLAGGVPVTEFELPFKKTEIARHLGLAAETLSRCLSTLAKKGVKVTGRKVRLEAPGSLCAYCDPLQGRKCSDRNKLRCHMFGL